MKSRVLCGVVSGILGGLVISTVAFADAPPGPAPTQGVHPCKAIEQACEAGGFVRGGNKDGKGIMKDCMKPIMSGQPVPGVTVDPATVQACQAKRAEWQSKHKQPPPAPPQQ